MIDSEANTPDVKVTPEMIEAGERELYSRQWCDKDEDVIVRVFLAMVACQPK